MAQFPCSGLSWFFTTRHLLRVALSTFTVLSMIWLCLLFKRKLRNQWDFGELERPGHMQFWSFPILLCPFGKFNGFLRNLFGVSVSQIRENTKVTRKVRPPGIALNWLG